MNENEKDAPRHRPWEPMRLTYVSSVGELMRAGFTGSRLDNTSAQICSISNRRSGGTGAAC